MIKKIKKNYRRIGHRKSSPKSAAKLKIYALGGLEEVGRNMTVFESDSDILILDMGHQFPEEDMHGIDYIIPNITSLKGKEKNIRGVILTHGHLDHIGAAPHLLPPPGHPFGIRAPATPSLFKKQIENYHQKFTPRIME